MPLRRLKYSRKIQVLFIPIFVLMAAGLVIVYQIAARSIRDEHEERLQRTAHLTEESLQATAKEMLKMADLFQTNRTVKEYLYLSAVLGADRDPLRDLLKPLAQSLDLDDLDLFDRSGANVIDIDRLPLRHPSRLHEFAGPLPVRPQSGFIATQGMLSIVALAPLHEAGRTVGYISVGKNIDRTYLEAFKSLSGNELFWVDADNAIHRGLPGAGSSSYSPSRGKLVIDNVAYSVLERSITSVDNKPLGRLVIALSDDDLNRSITKLKLSMLAMLGVAALLTYIGARLLIKTLVEPLSALALFTRKVARGELDDELALTGKDELTELGEDFNDMRKKLRAQREVVRQYTDNLERVVEERTAELQKVQRQLLQSQKMEAVGRLAGGIAHDFNNFLTAIMGFAGIFQRKLENDHPLRLYADHIVSTSKRAANLTRSLLTFSRKDAIQALPVDLNEVVRDAEKVLFRLIGEDIEFKSLVAASPLTVLADAGQLEQVLLNLATNARDAMPLGGCLMIETRQVRLDEGFVKKSGLANPGEYALLTFTDTGTGMNDETRDKVFEPFFTTKQPGKGTGLGLAIVYAIIKQHKGFISVYSEIDVGTTVKIYLPLVAPQPARPDVEEQSQALPGGSETILMAEDNQVVRELIRSTLAEAGYRVIVAVDGEEAVSTFSAQPRGIDMLLLDVIMPKKNGRQVYEEITEKRPDMKVLFLSGHLPDVLMMKGIVGQGVTLMQKPLSMNDLLVKVRSILDS